MGRVADKITIKQEKFVQGLFAGLSQRDAYKEAFNTTNMKEKTIDEKACLLAGRDKIRARLEELQNEVKERNMVTIQRILQEYARLGFYDPRKFFNDDGSPKGIQELDDDTAAVLAGLEVMEIWEGRGDNRQFVGYLKKYKLPDKKGALDSMARHLGMFVEKKEITGTLEVGIKLPSDIPDD
ncbi:MAG TPA: hypothetical protein DCZ10_18490 [Pelotomaculum sp.]|nr:hypothetical protein [Pelotomaculum sp.]